MHSKNVPFPLPGTVKIKSRNKLFPDLVFFFVLTALPSSFYALIDFNVFFVAGLFDYKMLFILASLPFLFLNLNKLSKFTKIPGAVPLLVVIFYLLFNAFYSLVRGIPLSEVITIMRVSYAYPVVALALLLYLNSMSLERIFRVFYWLFIVGFLQASIYTVSNLIGVEIFQAKGKDPLEFQGQILVQNTFALPQFNVVIFAIAFLTGILKRKLIFHVIWANALLITVLSFVRSQIVVYILNLIIIASLSTLFIKRVKFTRAASSLVGLMFIGLALLIIFPAHMDNLTQKIFGDEPSNTQELNTGTYDLRTKAIQASYEALKNKGILLFGTGYIREQEKGSYSFVLGSDTYVVPVLITEGITGIILRLFPIILLLFVNIKRLLNKKESNYHGYSIISIAIIIPELINIVQTRIFTHYHLFLFVLLALEIIRRKQILLEKRKMLTKSIV